MTIYTTLLVLYSLGVTIALVRDRIREARMRAWQEGVLRGVDDEGMDPFERAKLLLEVRRVENEGIPWYQKSLSMIGVVAFISMTVAAGVQTIRTVVAEERLERVALAEERLESDYSAAVELVEAVAAVSLSTWEAGGTLSEAERRVVRYRLEGLRAAGERSLEESRELYRLAVALQDFRLAIAVLEGDDELRRAANPVDQVALAEYYYLVGAHDASWEMIAAAERGGVLLGVPGTLRLFAVRAALDGELERALEQFVRTSPVDPTQARRLLTEAVDRLNQGTAALQPPM